MDNRVKTVKIKTEHFEATVDVPGRFFTIFGDFRTKDQYKIADNPYEDSSMMPLIDELYALESSIREMMPVIDPVKTEEEDDIPWPTAVSTS